MTDTHNALALASELDTKAQALGCPLDRFSAVLRLQHAQQRHLPGLGAVQRQRFSRKFGEHQQQQPCSHKSVTREQHLCRNVVAPDLQQCVALFDGRVGTAPKQAAQAGE